MIPVVALVGRPNVGKSTLFNHLTKTRDALVADYPGVTRDRQYGHCHYDDKHFIVVDTGGLSLSQENPIGQLAAQQVQKAIEEAHLLLFLVDAREGLTVIDEEIAHQLRTYNKPILLVINKVDGLDADLAASDFYRLGLPHVLTIAAAHHRGISCLIETILSQLPHQAETAETQNTASIKLAIIGKPNVGKSTLINRILGEERVMVFDKPGTTRDSIYIPFERRGKHYTLIDTAGMRRRSRISDRIEKFSVIKTLQAIEACHVVLFLIDARENISDQDLKLLGHTLEQGKSLIIAVNKWDGLTLDQKTALKKELSRRLVFVEFAAWHFISALHGTGVGNLFESIDGAYASATQTLSTPEATRLLEQAIRDHQIPLVSGKRIKLRYAHAGGHNPPIIVIHGTRVELLPASYKRYLENYFRKALKLVGTPIRLQFCGRSTERRR